jgi:hypothetical protein
MCQTPQLLKPSINQSQNADETADWIMYQFRPAPATLAKLGHVPFSATTSNRRPSELRNPTKTILFGLPKPLEFLVVLGARNFKTHEQGK